MGSRPLWELDCPSRDTLFGLCLAEADLDRLGVRAEECACGSSPELHRRRALQRACLGPSELGRRAGDLLDLRFADAVLAIRASGAEELRAPLCLPPGPALRRHRAAPMGPGHGCPRRGAARRPDARRRDSSRRSAATRLRHPRPGEPSAPRRRSGRLTGHFRAGGAAGSRSEPSSRTQTFRKRTGLPWSCRTMGPRGPWGA